MKRVVVILVLLALAGGGVYAYIYWRNADRLLQRGVSSMSRNHYQAARVAFQFVVDKYPLAPQAKDAKKYLADIRETMKRYFVHAGVSRERAALEVTQQRLDRAGVRSTILYSEKYPALPEDSFVLVLDRFARVEDANDLARQLGQRGITASVVAGY